MSGRRVSGALVLGALAACAPQPARPTASDGWEPSAKHRAAAPSGPVATSSPTRAAPPSAAATSASPVAAGSSVPPDPPSATRFPPAAFAPMHARTARPGDGEFQPMADGMRAGEPAMAKATVHPHPIKGFVFVDVIAFDRTRVAVSLVAGTEEPVSRAVPADQRPGVVPAADRDALLAVFNGGFMERHGGYGMMLDGALFVPPKEDACAVALYRDGALRVRSWSEIAATVGEMRAWRQTPPCLVEQGTVNGRLVTENATRRWGAAVGGARDIRRSAFGLDAVGRAFFYGFGDWVTATELAHAMKAAGAVDVAELDVNWSYTRFFLFAHPPGEPPRIRETLMAKLEFDRRRYVERPSSRDFFYVTLR